MNYDYADIRSRIAEEPTWWDERAVPRYGAFSPDALANIYALECALLLIRCQACAREFRVAMTRDAYDEVYIREQIRTNRLHYGDPPNVDCCPSGPTMNSEAVRVLEFWASAGGGVVLGWVRDPSFEIEFPAG